MFVDECSTNTSLSPIHGWSRRGQRVYFEAPRNWGANVTLLSSMSFSGMGQFLAVEGATTRTVFETYVEQVLAHSKMYPAVGALPDVGNACSRL